jgi:hypothetical protein
MLWSQFSAIFANFRWKNWRFLKNQCFDQIFKYFSFVLSQKRQFFSRFFCENIFKIISSVPGGSKPSGKPLKRQWMKFVEVDGIVNDVRQNSIETEIVLFSSLAYLCTHRRWRSKNKHGKKLKQSWCKLLRFFAEIHCHNFRHRCLCMCRLVKKLDVIVKNRVSNTYVGMYICT